MTKNGDFGQNLYIRSTSNGCRITETQCIQVFFALKHSVTIAEKNKLHMDSLYMGLSSNKMWY